MGGECPGADAQAIIGMSAGGITTIALAGDSPELVRKVVLVDVTPGVNETKSASIVAFVSGRNRPTSSRYAQSGMASHANIQWRADQTVTVSGSGGVRRIPSLPSGRIASIAHSPGGMA